MRVDIYWEFIIENPTFTGLRGGESFEMVRDPTPWTKSAASNYLSRYKTMNTHSRILDYCIHRKYLTRTNIFREFISLIKTKHYD